LEAKLIAFCFDACVINRAAKYYTTKTASGFTVEKNRVLGRIYKNGNLFGFLVAVAVRMKPNIFGKITWQMFIVGSFPGRRKGIYVTGLQPKILGLQN
jgi:hypothetical protein